MDTGHCLIKNWMNSNKAKAVGHNVYLYNSPRDCVFMLFEG